MATGARSDVLFSTTLYGHHKAMWEVVVSDDETVIYTHRAPETNDYRSEELNVPWRNVSDLLWELEGNILSQWDKGTYETGPIGQPGYWMVMLQRSRALHKWQGFNQYPPQWGRFLSMIEETIDRPLGI